MLMNNIKHQHRTHRATILCLICAVVFTMLTIQTAAAGVPEGNINSRGAGNAPVNNAANGYNNAEVSNNGNHGVIGNAVSDILPDGGARVRSSNGSDMVSDGVVSDKDEPSDSMFDKDNGVVSDKDDTRDDTKKADDSVTNPVKTEEDKINTAAIVIIIIVVLAIILLSVLLIPRKRKS